MNVNITEACRLFFVRSSYTASRTPIAWLSDDNLENIDPCLAAGPAKDQRTEGPEANRCKRTSTTDVRVMVKESFVWPRGTGSAVPSRISLLISILRLNLVLTYGIPPEFRGGVPLFNSKPPYAIIGSVPSSSGHTVAYR